MMCNRPADEIDEDTPEPNPPHMQPKPAGSAL